MKGHKKEHHKKAGGGKIDGSLGTKEEDKEVEEKKDTYKHGGKVKHKAKHKKHGGKVDGKKPHKRADKKARGGKTDMPKNPGGMSAHSPLSSAGATKDPKTPKLDKEDD
jgi:hypothetical protein